ncbi:MAG TPA: phosphoribosylanthranilate isomerase [Bacteroidales bacterium]|nr:phosphoribosylanthranilate isomerase [Bacteroidales bacterium]
MTLQIKICGLKDPGNIGEIIHLQPDYLGFILYRNSPRYVETKSISGTLEKIPSSIKKVGVLVNEPLSKAIELAERGIFDLLQLHGNEDPQYCIELSKHARLIKAFRVSLSLPPDLEDYMNACDMFLFDTAGPNFGGSGQKFDHSILQDYGSEKKFLLSGGISPSDAHSFQNCIYPKMAGLDINSRFEIRPGFKDINLLKSFIGNIRRNNNVC